MSSKLVSPLYCSCTTAVPLATYTVSILVKVPKHGHQLWDYLVGHGFVSGTEVPDSTMTQLELFSCLEDMCLETKETRGKNTSVGKINLPSHLYYSS